MDPNANLVEGAALKVYLLWRNRDLIKIYATREGALDGEAADRNRPGLNNRKYYVEEWEVAVA